jgi:Xaa-Pro aminopeptidase
MRQQLIRFQQALTARNLDGAVVAAPETLSSVNLRYLSGFTGSSAYLVVSQDRAWLLTDFRYTEQAEQESPDFELIRHGPQAADAIRELCTAHQLHRLGFEADKVPVSMWHDWQNAIPAVWAALDGLIEDLRRVKTAEEIALLKNAARIASDALLEILPGMVGKSEREVALDLELAMRRRGAEALAFSTIVASGERGSMPHASPTERRIQSGEFVTIDFGAKVNGYHSDETVTVATGPVAKPLQEIYALVERAQEAGIAAVKAGSRSHQVDEAARSIIEEAGYGEYFGHGTGHGVGLEVHEDPYAYPMRPGTPDWVLEPGMTITVEPGIYVPGLGGVRLEDTMVVAVDGAERLTQVPKHLRAV